MRLNCNQPRRKIPQGGKRGEVGGKQKETKVRLAEHFVAQARWPSGLGHHLKWLARLLNFSHQP